MYRALDERSGAVLALKQLRPPPGAEAALASARFEHEYHTLAQLSHPHIVRVHDYGLESRMAYYTMELLEGSDATTLRREPWPAVCQLLYDVASALALLHGRRLVHRDISPRNVRCATDGRAKLIDFGGLAPIGASRPVLGTPPFVPPEAVQLLVLDGRTDLYGLGALGYFLLTGYHAYPARTFRVLRDLWRSPPRPPQQHVEDVPPALGALVMQLLELERAARPRSAAEVMERLSTLAGLCPLERPAVGRGYLTTPALIGREEVLERVRTALARSATTRRGASFLLAGEPGSGRSRMLDACVLAARLHHLVVVRADAATGAAGPYALARVLCSQLQQEAPALRVGLDAPSSAADPGAPASDAHLRRAERQAVLRQCVATFTASRPLVIAVDGIEHADEPSAAWLAALCEDAPELPLVLLLTCEPAGRLDAAGSVMRTCATRLELPLLDEPQVEALVRAIFGDVEHVSALAVELHRLARGNLGLTLGLCEGLIETGVARYRAGRFRLAPGISSRLPASMGAAFSARLRELPADALELAQTLALTDPLALPAEEYAGLCADRDHGRSYRALDALLAAGVLVPEGDRFRFVHPELRELLARELPAARAAVFHQRLLPALQRAADGLLLCQELLGAGRPSEAVEHALARPPGMRGHPAELRLLARLLEASEQQRMPVQTQIALRERLVRCAAGLGDLEVFERHAPWLLARLERDSGGGQVGELDGASESGPGRASTEAQAPHEGASASGAGTGRDAQRGLSSRASLQRLLALCAAFVRMSGLAQDLALLERLPSLRAFCELGPEVEVTRETIEIQRDMLAGRYDDAIVKSRALLARLEQPERAGLDAAAALQLRAVQRFMLGTMAAAIGDRSALQWVAEYESQPGARTHATRVRMVFELMHGDLARAAECRRQAELLNLSDGGETLFAGVTVRAELLVHWYAGDLLAVQSITERIDALAARYPGWRATAWLARYYECRLKGDADGSLAAAEAALQRVQPGRDPDWGFAVVSQLHALLKLGRGEEALAHGRRYLAQSEEQRLFRTRGGLLQCIAESLLALGRPEEALPLMEEQVAWYEQLGASGLLIAFAYEVRARVAVALHDAVGARRFAAACARHSGAEHEPTHSPAYRRIVAMAETHGLSL